MRPPWHRADAQGSTELARDPGERSPAVYRWVKRLAVWTLQLAFLALCLEVGAMVAYPWLTGRPYSRDRLVRDLEARRASAGGEILADAGVGRDETAAPAFLAGQVPHPYVGFVLNPNKRSDTNALGFTGESPLIGESPDVVNVVVLGGSVAHGMVQVASEPLLEELRQAPRFAGKHIRLVSLALPGYKQPQQLLALTYMLSLGAKYDVVINLDGFNEIVLPFSDNIPSGTPMPFPRLWSLRARRGLSVQQALLLANVVRLRRQQARLSQRFSSPWLRWSNFALVLWDRLDTDREAAIRRAHLRFVDASAREESPLADDTDEHETDLARYLMDGAELWAHASEQMHRIATANGFEYHHFLQPNQYVPGSKKLTDTELRIAHIDAFEGADFPYHPSVRSYKWGVESGYPLLSAAGEELRRRGVAFHDLTMMFEDVSATVYDDACCHLNDSGYGMLARRIGKEVARQVPPPS